MWRLVRDYLFYANCLDGVFGLLTSVLSACACFLKCAALWENRNKR